MLLKVAFGYPCILAAIDSASKEILERDGLNELEKPPKPTLLLLFLMQLLSFGLRMPAAVNVMDWTNDLGLG